MGRIRKTYYKIRGLDQKERVLLVSALFLLPVVSLSLRIYGYKSTRAKLRRFFSEGTHGLSTMDSRRIASIARIVAVAACHLPGSPTCLAQSVTLWFLLARLGVASQVKIGVSKSDGIFGAHAWVEVGGKILLDHQDVGNRYQVIA